MLLTTRRVGWTLVGSGLAVACSSGGAPATGVTPPPRAVSIVFDMQAPDRGGVRDIYTEALDGTDLVRLTSDSTDHHAPSASTSSIFFGSTRPVGDVVAFVAPAGGPTLDLGAALGSSRRAGRCAQWHRARLCLDDTASPRLDVGRHGFECAALRPADAGWDGAIEGHPSWSPTGDRIAYVTTRSGNPAIFIGAANGATGSATLLTGSVSGASIDPAWSPDGTRLVFTSNRDGPTDLYVVTVATNLVLRLTNIGNVGQPTWLPNGRIVFTQGCRVSPDSAWLDPAAPSTVHAIPTAGDAQHAASIQ